MYTEQGEPPAYLNYKDENGKTVYYKTRDYQGDPNMQSRRGAQVGGQGKSAYQGAWGSS